MKTNVNLKALIEKMKNDLAEIDKEISKANKILTDIETIDKEHSPIHTNEELYALWWEQKILLHKQKVFITTCLKKLTSEK